MLTGVPDMVGVRMVSYSDADFAGAADRYSQSGSALVMVGPKGETALVNGATKRQGCLSLSTCDSELGGIVDTCRLTNELHNLLLTLPVPVPIVLRSDNTAAISAVKRG